ncbi:chromophore lyase CpcT/CpeT [Calothrix sp. PCC 6303]|uniref:chromophore lyase CpcT/CpeT n=1 Tax=Calothrix sp. PCC 6303 TaxID=1170562 RepID=UPI0002A04408|nr:chromophore lyase CpcT/CpeT [Calothrix sp. PCC 6303]AFZ04473.1 protein of unknown function DUF1001 [Calothrix sp. PCC 6303]
MNCSSQLLTLGNYLAGEFDNSKQSLAEPAWFVHLRLWHIPVPLFPEDSITFFAEQANIVNLDQPYRQRIIRIRQVGNVESSLQVQYYALKDYISLVGAGKEPGRLKNLTPDDLEDLPGCVLEVEIKETSHHLQFIATPVANSICSFRYNGNIVRVSLGFEVTQEELKTYDKGIDPETGRATWGAILGPYHYQKRKQSSLS